MAKTKPSSKARKASKAKRSKKRLMTAEDIYRFNLINSCELSPDEKRVAYIVETVSPDHKKYFSRLHLADRATGESTQFTFGEVSDRSPVWSPCGQYVAFFSTRNKKSGIYIIPANGGAERLIIEEDGAFFSLKWAPDGKTLYYSFRYNDSHDIEDEEKKKEPPLFRHIDRLFYRLDGSGFLPKDRFHIWSVDIETGKSKQLTKGKYDDTLADVSKDGKELLFTSNKSASPDVDRLHIDMFTVPSNGSKVAKIPTPVGPVINPTYAPDGKLIAYIGHDRPDDGWGTANYHIWVVGKKGTPKAYDTIPKFDRSCLDTTIGDTGEGEWAGPLNWSNDGKRIYFTASDLGSTHIFFALVRGGLPTRVTHKNYQIKSYSMAGKKKTIVAVSADLSTPSNLIAFPATYGGDKKPDLLLQPNRDVLKEILLPKTKEIWFKGHDGFDLQGWLVTPPNFKPTKKYPAILEIHGGPRTQYGFTFFHEMNYLASQGYVVFYTNPRGGQGRGEMFAAAISGGWGELDYMDCMAATDYLENLKYVDSKNIGVTGGSYGGYMTNWMIGHTQRFKAAVTQRSVVNLESFFGSSDIGYSLYREFDGFPWDNLENYRKCSPLTYAKNMRTPLLIIHSENDLRCGIEQGEELFATLKMMKRKVEMVRFPGEPHGLSRHGRPDRRIARLEWIVKWFDRYMK